MSLQSLLSDLLGRLQLVDGAALLIGFDETRSWPENALDALVQSRLVAPVSPAKSLVCGGCEEDCVMPVQTLPGIRPRALIVCDKREDIGRIPVALERLQQWQLSEAAVVRVLLDAIDGHPVIEQQVRDQLAALPLHQLLSFEQGQLQVDTDRLLRQLLPQSDTPQPNRFALTGDHWTITYEGQTRTLKDTKGIRYIAYLIQNQGKEIHVSDLYYAINPPDANAIDATHSSMTEEQLGKVGLSVTDLGDAGDVLTPESKRRIQQAIRQLNEQIKEATEMGDEDKQEMLEEKKDNLIEYISTQSGLGGKSRKASSAIERIRIAVTLAIHRSIKKIGGTLPELGDHLHLRIRTGTQCKYTDPETSRWEIGIS